jgi:phosphate butyryltransferase
MKLEDLLFEATKKTSKVVAVAAAEDEEVIDAVSEAIKRDLGHFMLFGKKDKIEDLLIAKGIGKDRVQIIQARTSEHAAELAVRAVHQNEASVLMKGNVATATLLKAVLNKEYGLRTDRVLSHVAVFEINGFPQLKIVTDAAMNIAPDLQQKMQIVVNAVEIARAIGVNQPKVAALAAVEVINPAMQATIDAASLTLMNRRGQIKNCIIDGPLALDNAISFEAAKHKGIESEVAGYADILLVPSIEAGNVLYKSLSYFARAKVGAVIAGAKAPIVLPSRSDSSDSKLYSLALAIYSSEK